MATRVRGASGLTDSHDRGPRGTPAIPAFVQAPGGGCLFFDFNARPCVRFIPAMANGVVLPDTAQENSQQIIRVQRSFPDLRYFAALICHSSRNESCYATQCVGRGQPQLLLLGGFHFGATSAGKTSRFAA
jgi:hypothetical protein